MIAFGRLTDVLLWKLSNLTITRNVFEVDLLK